MTQETQTGREASSIAAALKQPGGLVALEGIDWRGARDRVSAPEDLLSYARSLRLIDVSPSTLPPELEALREQLRAPLRGGFPIELAGSFKVTPLGGKALVLVPEDLREALSDLLKRFIPESSFLCSSTLGEGLQRADISLIASFHESYPEDAIRKGLDSEGLDIPIEAVPPAEGIFGLAAMARIFEIVETFHSVKNLAASGTTEEAMASYPEVGVYGVSTGHLLRGNSELVVNNLFEVLSRAQNRGNPLQEFAELSFPETRDALRLICGSEEATGKSDAWEARPGFASSYAPQEIQDLLLCPGATLVSLISSGSVLGYIVGYTMEEHFPQRGTALIEALRQSGQPPQGKSGYLKMIEITPVGRMFAKLHQLSFSDELLAVMFAYGQQHGIDQFIFECREFPFPNEAAIKSHLDHKAQHTGVSLASSTRGPDGDTQATIAGIFTIEPACGLEAVVKRDERAAERARSRAARQEQLRKGQAQRAAQRFFVPEEDQGLSAKTLQQMTEPEILSRISHQEFILLVSQLQDVHFSEAELSCAVSDALHAARTGLMDAAMVDGLNRGRHILDIGCGEALMARLLVNGFGVDAENILLSDKFMSMRVKNSSMRFEMLEQGALPTGNTELFDYIVFEKMPGKALSDSSASTTYRFYEQTRPVEQAYRDGKLFSLSERERNLFLEIVGSDVPHAESTFKVLKNACLHLKPGGEIRIGFSGLTGQGEAYLVLRLKELFPEVEYDLITGTICITFCTSTPRRKITPERH